MAASIDIVFREDKLARVPIKETENLTAPLHIRIIKNRKVRYIATGHKLSQKYWDFDRRKVKNNYPNSVRLNNYLNALKVKYLDEVLKEETHDTTVSSKRN